MTKDKLRLHQLDLNLLRVLKVVHSTRSVTQAAQQLFMTQSAVSNALRRLRTHLDDPLFIRSQEGMLPTSLAETILPTIDDSLRNIEEALQSHKRFDPASSTRLFRFLTNDLAQMFFLPPLIKHLSAVAPDIRMETVDASLEEGRRALVEGRLDLAIGNWPGMGNGYHRTKLFSESFVVLMSARHPLASKKLRKTDYLAARHIDYKPGGESYNALRSKLDKILKEEGGTQNIYLTAGHGLGLGSIVAESLALLTIPSRLAAAMMSDRDSLVIKPLPYNIPTVTITMQWHARSHHDPALIWFRKLLNNLFQDAP